jgi:hypothetical protein
MGALRRYLVMGMSGALLAAAAALVPTTADAHTDKDVLPQVCNPGGKSPYYKFSGKKLTYLRARDGRIYGQSGVTLSISKGVSKTIGGSVTGTGSAEAGVIFAKASVSLAISVQYSRTTTTTFGASWTVPKSQPTGWLEVGTNNGYTFRWKRYHYRSPCTVVVDAHGTAKGPKRTAALFFKHS